MKGKIGLIAGLKVKQPGVYIVTTFGIKNIGTIAGTFVTTLTHTNQATGWTLTPIGYPDARYYNPGEQYNFQDSSETTVFPDGTYDTEVVVTDTAGSVLAREKITGSFTIETPRLEAQIINLTVS